MIKTILANRYRVIKRLGEGGMGSVYLARDNKLHMLWAIKELGDSGLFLNHARKSEISVLRKVSHPNLPRVTDIFDEGKKTYMVMDYIEGKTLEEILASSKKIPSKKIYQWSLEITSALHYLHSMNPPVIYRDLKPSNIMIRPSGSAVLIDFGTAKSFEKSSDEFAVGTKGYAAPEQYEGISDKKSDIYSAGRVIQKMTKGEADWFLKRICKRCCMKDPKERYKDAQSLNRALAFAKDAYKYILVTFLVTFIVGAGVLSGRNTAKSSVRDIEEINEAGRMNNLYDNALMCFYELKDYEAAAGYLEQLKDSGIPEVSWYEKLCSCLLSPESGREEVIRVAGDFREFNEREVQKNDPKRKLKNDTDIARLYLMYAKNDASLLEEAVELLEGVNREYEKDGTSSERKLNALALLESAYRSLGQVNDKKDNFIKAVNCNDRMKNMEDADDDFIIRRYLNSARMLEELRMFARAKEEYAQCERRFPYRSPEIYTGHLRLLIATGENEETIRRFYNEACKVDGITGTKEFIKISERMAYEGQ